MALEEMDVARVNPYCFDPFLPGSATSALGLVPAPPANGGSPNSGGGGDSRSASYPVGDVHRPGLHRTFGNGG